MRISSFSEYLLFPFNFEALQDNLKYWSRTEPLGNFNVLLPHVRQIVSENDNMDFYRLDDDQKSPASYLMSRLLKDKTTAPLTDGELIDVKFADTIYPTPRLVVCESQKTAILMLPITFAASRLSEICEISYQLIKMDHQRIRFHTEFNSFQGIIKYWTTHDLEQGYADLCSALKCPAHSESHAVDYTIRDLRDELLSGIDGVTYYNSTRANTFFCFNSPEDTLTDADKADLLCIVHGVGSKYHVDISASRMLHTFTDILAITSTESALLLTYASEASSSHGFFKNFRSNSLPRYLLIYMLALLQQQMQMSVTHRLAHIATDDKADSMHVINTIYANLAHAQSAFYFVDISTFAHINRYYAYCIDMLRVPQLYEHNKEKIKDLYSVANHLVEKRRYNVNRIMTIFLGILTFLSTIGALIDMYSHRGEINTAGTVLFALLILVIAIGALSFYMIYKRLR